MSTPLPPTSRDFDIHRLSLVELVSTRRIAEIHKISQTRVRQIVAEVSTWLAARLPFKTEAEQEQEKRLAIHVAAAQLQHQIQELQIFGQQTSDPKYLRQQTRAILALARLGVLPGALDSLAASRGAGVPPAAMPYPAERPAPRSESVEDNLVTRVHPGNPQTRGSSLADAPADSVLHSASSSQSPLCNSQFAICTPPAQSGHGWRF